MTVTTLRQMRQMAHTEIDDSFKSELLRDLGGFPKFFASLRSATKYFCLILKKSLITTMTKIRTHKYKKKPYEIHFSDCISINGNITISLFVIATDL